MPGRLWPPSETAWASATATSTRASVIGLDGSRIATKDGVTTAYLVPDPHGNVAATETASTAIANAIRYDGYGQTLGTPYVAAGAITLDTKYQGRLDLSPNPAFPVYEFSARNMSPTLGTFTSLDTYAGSAQDPASMNRFLYAQANPTTLIDPTGHGTECQMAISCSAADRAVDRQHQQAYEQRKQQAAPSSSAPKPHTTTVAGAATPPVHDTWSMTTDERATAAAWAPGGIGSLDPTCNQVLPHYAVRGCQPTAGDPSQDVLGGIVTGVWNGTIGGAIGLGQHILGNLDKIPTGVGVLLADPGGSAAALAEASGFDDPAGNLARGWDAISAMSPRDKAEFWSAIVAGAVVGAKAPRLPGAGRAGGAKSAQGPTLSLDRIRVTRRGVDVVERHLARFVGPDQGLGAAEAGMVTRLRNVVAGDLAPAAQDIRFYAHELRESVLYRRAGYGQGQPAGEAGYYLWDRLHTQALADYGYPRAISGDFLYHPSVLEPLP